MGATGKVLAVEIDRDFFPHIQQKAKAAGVTNVQTIAGEPVDPKLPEVVDVALLHDVLHHVDNPAAYIKGLAKYLKPTTRIVIVDYLAKQGPHRDDPSLQVGKEEAAKLLASIGFKPLDDVALFPDKLLRDLPQVALRPLELDAAVRGDVRAIPLDAGEGRSLECGFTNAIDNR